MIPEWTKLGLTRPQQIAIADWLIAHARRRLPELEREVAAEEAIQLPRH